jgi:membrane-bound lytic murein transglycosylase A
VTTKQLWVGIICTFWIASALAARPPFAPEPLAALEQDQTHDYITPTEKVTDANWPVIADDLAFSGMELALQRQLQRFKEIDMTGTITMGEEKYNLSSVRRSLLKFFEMVRDYDLCAKRKKADCEQIFSQNIKRSFNLYRPKLEAGDPRFGEEKSTLFTGYYLPSLLVSDHQTPDYPYPIYAQPFEEKSRGTSRVDIDFHHTISNQGLEIFYYSNLFDLYLMHVQGSAHAYVNTGRKIYSRYLNYTNTNGLPWQFISKYMLEKKMITDASISSQREFLASHPEKHEEIYATCPSYVYVHNSRTPPIGCGGAELTDNRSVATDTQYYRFKGLLSFVVAERPEENTPVDAKTIQYRPFSRFFLDQDTGGAIKGKARADIFFGEGSYAELAASHLTHTGDIYFLMLKREARK